MKKALMKTSVKILVLGLALTAMLFGCKQPSGSSNSAGSGGGNGSDESGEYSITYHLDGGTNNVDNPASYTKNDEFPLRAPSKEGQVFDGWFGNSEFSGEAVTKIAKGTTGKKEFWAKWVAENESVAYKVEHLQQNAENENYTKVETEPLKGGKGSKTLAVAKQYEGFTAQPFEQKTINEDGSTVVEIKYDRKIITLTLDLDGGTISPAIPGNKITGKFGAAVTKPADPSKDGNLFSGWAPEIPAEFSKDSTHTAQWTINITVNVGDERIESYTGPALSNKKPGVKWSDIKPSDETIKLKPEWQGGDYGLYEWRLNDENGQKIDDDYTFTKDTTVYAVTNYLRFKTETENGELCISENKGYTGEAPRGKIIIPAGTENNPMVAIGKYAFYGCSGLTSISLPASLTRIEGSAFEGCSSLESISLPAGLTEIGNYAFQGCSNLTIISLPAGITKINYCTFGGCSSLTSISLPTSLTRIEGYAFQGCSSLTSISLPASLTMIAGSAFNDCSGLNSVIFADKKGWAVYNWSNDINKIADISETDLEDPANAATLLKTTYSDKKWKKN